jgi:hypothetical protein
VNGEPGGVYEAAVLRVVESRRGPIKLWGVKRPDGTWRTGVGGVPQWHIQKAAAEREAAEFNRLHGLTATADTA